MIRARAFTLVELLMTLAVLGIVSMLVVASTAEFGDRQRFEGLLRQIGDAYAAARASAICRHQVIEVHYDPRNGKITASSGGPSPEAMTEMIDLPGEVTIVSVSPSTEEEVITMPIGPDGMGRSHQIVLRWNDVLRGTVAVNGFTGQCAVRIDEIP